MHMTGMSCDEFGTPSSKFLSHAGIAEQQITWPIKEHTWARHPSSIICGLLGLQGCVCQGRPSFGLELAGVDGGRRYCSFEYADPAAGEGWQKCEANRLRANRVLHKQVDFFSPCLLFCTVMQAVAEVQLAAAQSAGACRYRGVRHYKQVSAMSKEAFCPTVASDMILISLSRYSAQGTNRHIWLCRASLRFKVGGIRNCSLLVAHGQPRREPL